MRVRHAARQQLPQRDAETVHIYGGVVRPVLDYLWRHPPIRSRLRRHDALVIFDARHPEVCHLNHPVLVYEQVRRLEVSVDDFVLVQIVHAARYVQSRLGHCSGREPHPLPPPVELVKAPPLHKLRHYVKALCLRAHPDELHHILVADLSQDRHLLAELALHGGALRDALRAQHLHGDGLPAVHAFVQVCEGPRSELGAHFQLRQVHLPIGVVA
mmetsp:Transcript_18771/g.31535  ORF Transcript_18771/g.31535 Transcript_18771/m.31535 type:complete len:214 (-) Transcript_18771:1552-2193(-)